MLSVYSLCFSRIFLLFPLARFLYVVTTKNNISKENRDYDQNGQINHKSAGSLGGFFGTRVRTGTPGDSGYPPVAGIGFSGTGAVASIVQRIGVAPAQITAAADEALSRMPRVSGDGGQPGLGRDANQALDLGWRHASNSRTNT